MNDALVDKLHHDTVIALEALRIAARDCADPTGPRHGPPIHQARHRAAPKGQRMAAGINKVILIGNLGRDPEVKYTQSGTAICTLSVGCTSRKKDGDGWKDHTEWVRVKAFGKIAENAGQYLQKGRQVYVEGRLETSKYKDKESGADRYSTDVIADVIQFLGSKSEGDGDRPGGGGRSGGSKGGKGKSGGSDRDDAQGDGGGDSGGGDGFIDDGDLPF